MHVFTDRFSWIAKDDFLNNIDNLDLFFQSRRKTLGVSYLQEEDSPLSFIPDPWTMKDMRKAAQRVVHAIKHDEKIVIFGDYDVDGTTSCAMLFSFFRDLNKSVTVAIPDRLTEGYGLTPSSLQKQIRQGVDLVITVDNGISSLDACNVANQCGLDVIITDHHDLPPVLPSAFAILNPKQPDCGFPYRMLAGVGVAFYLLIAVRSCLREAGLLTKNLNLRHYLDFVALGTIADMAPLDGVNHMLCKVGLQVLNEHLQSGQRRGIFHLLKKSGWNESQPVTAADVGFKIGPRLNAAGRLSNALKSVDILCLDKEEQPAFAMAEFLHDENTERQNLEKKFVEEALEEVRQKTFLPEALVLHQEHWHPGVVGLVANRILEQFYRPVLVFGTVDGKLKGSGRSTHAFDLFAALDEVRSEFLSFGGHFHAVGLTLDPEKLPWLTGFLTQRAGLLISEREKKPPLFFDGKLPLSAFNQYFLEKLEEFEPYGIGNQRTRWLIGPVQIRKIKRIGRDVRQGHAKVLFQEKSDLYEGQWITAFGLANLLEKHFYDEIYAIIEAKQSVWQGRLQSDLRLLDCLPVSLFKGF